MDNTKQSDLDQIGSYAEEKSENKTLNTINIPSSIEVSKKEVLQQDQIINAMINGDNPFDILDVIHQQIAEEGASLKYERIKRELRNQDTDRISLRRANILKMLSDSVIQKRNLALNDIINLKSPQWQLVFEHLLSKVKLSLQELGYSSEQIELFFRKFQNNLEGFEEEMELKLKDSFIDLG